MKTHHLRRHYSGRLIMAVAQPFVSYFLSSRRSSLTMTMLEQDRYASIAKMIPPPRRLVDPVRGFHANSGRVHVNIRFYKTTGEGIFAEFFLPLIASVNRSSQLSLLISVCHPGEPNARVRKLRGETKVTVTAGPIKWKAEFHVDAELKENDVSEHSHGIVTPYYRATQNKTVDITGRLQFKDSEAIEDGILEYTSYFMSYDYPDAFVEHLGDQNKVFSDVRSSYTGKPKPK
ncbi:hypothetical protein OG21DRAFT_1499392 [Imleria badia]|nr:hypothetical protein OG21DRAFT_1499392 [Imleria badia]